MKETSGMPLSSKPKVYFLTGLLDTQLTGGILIDREMLEALRKEYDVTVIHPGPKPSRSGRFPTLVGLISNFWEVFRPFPPHSVVFLSHGVYRDTFLAIYLWRWLWKIRIVFIVYHFDYNLKAPGLSRRLRIGIEAMAVRPASKLLTISEMTANQAVSLGISKLDIINLPVSRRFWPQADPIDRADINFLFVGNVDARKGVLDAVRALAQYQGTARGTFRIVGSFRPDQYGRQIIAAASECEGFRIEIVGQIDQDALADEFRRASVFLFPSYWEGYGIAVEEAMCFGLPVITYASGSLPELVTDGIEGWVVPTGDVEALARAITECVDDAKSRRDRGRHALVRAKLLTGNGTPGETAVRVAREVLRGPQPGED